MKITQINGWDKLRTAVKFRQRLSLDISISTKYVYVRKHTHNNNEKATEISVCECSVRYVTLPQRYTFN